MSRHTTAVELRGRYSNPESCLEQLQTVLRRLDKGPHLPQPPRRAPKQVQHRLSSVEVAQLAEAYARGASPSELSARFQVHRTTVVAHLERQGMPTRIRGLDPAQIEEAIRLYGEGWSLTQLGVHLSVDRKTVYYRLRQAGVQLRPRPGWKY